MVLRSKTHLFFWGESCNSGARRRAFLPPRAVFVKMKEQPTADNLFVFFADFNDRLGQSRLSRLVAPRRSFKLGGCDG